MVGRAWFDVQPAEIAADLVAQHLIVPAMRTARILIRKPARLHRAASHNSPPLPSPTRTHAKRRGKVRLLKEVCEMHHTACMAEHFVRDLAGVATHAPYRRGEWRATGL